MKKRWLFGILLAILVELPFYSSLSQQYLDLTGDNPDIKEYVESSAENWNKSIIYIFYSNEPCDNCAQAIEQIYDIYQRYYSEAFSIFEINYEAPGEFNFKIDYQLSQPLTIVMVRINDGMARGYSKIENPQIWLNDPLYFEENITNQINNFLVY